MGLDQPATQAPLPKDLQDHIERVRSEVHIQEIGLHNLKKARFTEEQTISELIRNKETLKQEVLALEDIRKMCQNDVDTLKAVKETLTESIEKSEAHLDRNRQEIIKNNQEIAESKKIIEKKLASIQTDRDALAVDQEKFSSEKSKLDEFKCKIIDVISSYSF
jgi:chromosome segregation ATPase